MDAQKCLEILRDIKDTAFATVDKNGMPQIRIIDIMLVENEKLYFCTSRGKDFYKQLIASPYVAVTAMTKNYQMIRLNGKAEKLAEQKKWIDRIFEENPSMNDVYPNDSRYVLEPFCISDAQIEFFDLSETPIFRESYCIGNYKMSEQGFYITDTCIGCGKCKNVCPQNCIEKGVPYEIQQKHCLHCGLCYESCPVGAIERRRKE